MVKNDSKIPKDIIINEIVIDQKSLNFHEKFRGIYVLKLNELVSLRISSKAEIPENSCLRPKLNLYLVSRNFNFKNWKNVWVKLHYE